jgi:hypothetical protein
MISLVLCACNGWKIRFVELCDFVLRPILVFAYMWSNAGDHLTFHYQQMVPRCLVTSFKYLMLRLQNHQTLEVYLKMKYDQECDSFYFYLFLAHFPHSLYLIICIMRGLFSGRRYLIIWFMAFLYNFQA